MSFVENSVKAELNTHFQEMVEDLTLKVHKNENFFGFDFEFCPISLLVMHK